MKNTFYVIVCIFIFLFLLANKCDKSLMRDAAKKAKQPKEEIHCIICGQDLTDTYQRIRPNGDGYFCMPCYNGTMKEIHDDMRAEGYDTKEYMNGSPAYSESPDYDNSTINTNDYSNEPLDASEDAKIPSNDASAEAENLPDESLPDSKVCKICFGTGTQKTYLNGVYKAETCSRCSGTGHEGY